MTDIPAGREAKESDHAHFVHAAEHKLKSIRVSVREKTLFKFL